MLKQRSQSTPEGHDIQLSPTQYAHFTDGDGLFVKGSEGDTVGFIHETNFDNSLETLRLHDRIGNACEQLYFLAAALSPGNEVLELNPQAQLGLNQIICQIREQLTMVECR
ncbi:hypothetical protein [Microbulbifer discodermiae]|uniref:hypothetical protein n=1 Tax=Microbulbifer sp. 2201CG32-9 TaxID=3232309 RepID=UPI00345C2240